ncbi:glutamine--fructose-6-phosphate transaminase (isomerizing) [Candidatus Saccharibacteria bacterium]|nr:glutamine--fructose-6-phosphate transaminase (isomerizing) [Candidatus Saccharibacteria bacterium]
MCGIVGYIGNKSAVKPVLSGLKALEYRGYDSAGISFISKDKPLTIKQVGRVEALEEELAEQGTITANLAIGHTRWATHGSPSILNAHPHQNTDETIFVVHNGIIENYQVIRSRLQKFGYKFVSETDTEVIPHLIDYYLIEGVSQETQASGVQGTDEERKEAVPISTVTANRSSKRSNLGASAGRVLGSARKQAGTVSFLEAFEAALKDLVGAYAIGAVYAKEPGKIYVARLSSPLVIGVGVHENFLASDPTAIMEHTKKVIYLNDYEVAEISADDVKIHDIQKAIAVHREHEELDFDQEKAVLGDYPHFMLKEIFEAPQTIQSATRGRLRADTNTVKLGGLESVDQQLKYIDRIVIVACGTSYYAGLVGEYLIEELAGIPVEVQLASEFKYRNEPFSRSTALLAISQSGETADTIAAIKKVEGYGVLRLGIVNTVGSTIARMTDAGVYCHAGPEQSVASTKAFIAQVTVLAEIALHLSQGRTRLYKPLLQELLKLPEKAKEILEHTEEIEILAKKYSGYRDFLYLGRNYSYPCALEGALKLKEISYIHAEGFAAGEMKHGPLAMIDQDFPTFAIACKSPLLEKTLSNIEEIKARKGPVLVIATKGDKQIKKLISDVIYIPDTLEQLQPLLIAIVLQLFSYYVAVEKNLNVDRPRNLAKSVTVE